MSSGSHHYYNSLQTQSPRSSYSSLDVYKPPKQTSPPTPPGGTTEAITQQASNQNSTSGYLGTSSAYDAQTFPYFDRATSPTSPIADLSATPSSPEKRRANSHSPPTTRARDPSGVIPCPHKNCQYQTKRQHDLKRHQKATHFSHLGRFDCPERGCGRVGKYGFNRKDHLREHLTMLHAKKLPKSNRGGKSNRVGK